MTSFEVAAAIIVTAIVAAVGAAALVASLFALSKHGEAARFTTLLEPVHSAIEDLEDRIDHVRKRAYKRDRDERKETGGDELVGTRRDLLRDVARRSGVGIFGPFTPSEKAR